MSTTTQAVEGIKGNLNQIGNHLLKIERPLLPEQKASTELAYLETLNGVLKSYRQQFLTKSRAFYQALEPHDLPQKLALLKTTLNAHLQDLDLSEQIGGKSRKSFMTYNAGFTALEHEAALGVQDRLLHPQEQKILAKVSRGPALRPGVYALTFRYQEQVVELAGAFVLTEKSSPLATDLSPGQAVGAVMLFTPAHGIESFDSLDKLNNHLLQGMDDTAQHRDFMSLLPMRYHALTPAGIWPLELSPITDEPLFEHTYNALLDKRTQDIDRALSLIDNPTQDAAQLIDALDLAITCALPDLNARLEWRAQRLLERHLRNSAPDWYRSASETRRATLAEHLARYNEARQDMLDLLNPVATPETLARYQLLERLSDDLDIHHLNPEHLQVITRRHVAPIGEYEHDRNLIDLALRGLRTGDELPGSDFLEKTTLLYNGAPLPEDYDDLTPAWLAQQLSTLQPRIAFGDIQIQLHKKPELRHAIEQMLDQRINALAYTAVLQGHLREDDFQLVQSLRQDSDSQLSAATLSLHEAQLQDLWVLRQSDASGVVKRLLLCTPEAPQEQQFQAFDSEIACQNHILGWSLDNGHREPPGTLTDYLIKRVPLRFRPAMKRVLSGLSFKPHAQEYNEVAFNNIGSHADCLKAMSAHVLATRIDDYALGTPNWFRSTSTDNRRKLLQLAEDSRHALRIYNDLPLSEARYPSFSDYLHEQAKKKLNELLGRRQNDVDPDTVWAYSPAAVLGKLTPPPLTYTELYRDGYSEGVGFLDQKFSRSARFKGPQGIDISPLTAEKVARSVTGVWIGARYINELKAKLLDRASAGYSFRRNATLAITQLQLQTAALESRLQGDIADVDLIWLNQSIASMGETSTQTRGNYAIHRLLIDGEWIIDTYLFSHGDNPVLLYTPQAPDGISFREARQFNYLLKKLPGMITYLTSRVGVPSRTRVRTFLEEAQKQLPENLDKTTASPARYDSTRAIPPVLDLRRLLYDMKLQRKIDDVQATTVNRTQMIAGILWTCVEWVSAVATAPFPALSLSLGMLLAFKDGMLALHAYHQGDDAGALKHLIGYLLNSAGAAFTDLRPALASLEQLSKPALRQVARRAPQNPVMKLIQQLEPAPLPTADMQRVLFDSEFLWAKKTPDEIGRYLLYRLDPISGQLVSTTRVAAPNAQGVWTRTGVTGGAPKYEKLPEAPDTLKNYEMPAKHWRDVERVLDPDIGAAMRQRADEWFSDPGLLPSVAAAQLAPALNIYKQQVERLTKDAQNFFKYLDPLAPRADALAVEANTQFPQLIASDAFAANQNLVIGAVPGSIASKQLLIEQMDALIENGFKRLYVEYLPGDVFRPKLEKLNRGKSWKHIERHLKNLDKTVGFAENAEYSYLALVRKAREKGIKIKALDASTSYHLEDALQMGDTSPTTPRDNAIRNFYSHRAIEADALTEPDERWVALVDSSRLRTFNETPGLADLQNAVALRVEDIGPNQPVGIWADTPGSIPGDPSARGDYRMTLQTSYKAPAPIEPKAGGVSAGQVDPVAGTSSSVLNANEFDIPVSMRDEIIRLDYSSRRGLDPVYRPRGGVKGAAFDTFIEARTRLHVKAEEFFTDYTPPSRPTLPTITDNTTPESFLKQISDSSLPGLVLGEPHGMESSKKLLITQMETIKKLGFKTLYVEHLYTDLHQAELEVFLKTQQLPDNLKRYLKQQDIDHMHFRHAGPHTYTEVYQAASKYGIRIRALDCVASYNLKGMPDDARTKMFNYFASRVIHADQAAHGPHKWIAFVGNSHANYYAGVPGLAELLTTVSLNVRDVAPGLGKKIHLGHWETLDSIKGRSALRNDFKLEEVIVGQPARIPDVPVDRSTLKDPRHYLIERLSDPETNLLRYSAAEGIISTPIQIDDTGLFFIDLEGMAHERFKYQKDLIYKVTRDLQLTPAPVVPAKRTWLKKTGHYVIERPSETEANLIHLSRNDGVMVTAIQKDDAGKYFITRWNMEQRRFDSEDALIKSLQIYPGLRPAPAP
ncbi:membrane-targeted effector domain-containing toxin [Pseudomonas sp. R2-7-07]|uniref:membrane-targeted effector domain-containing toxin n=1 Tax=Pseudomonas sp. R2-7-07 TaxID=658641 RepID=UPI000F6D495F|nr:membrane-targeted effector domain-containing toxin [Pseudomonas sp. R2-7-07]AZF49474.1 hypothetical protein C4J86_4269 [Pseudomonas sp. R2-7-07]